MWRPRYIIEVGAYSCPRFFFAVMVNIFKQRKNGVEIVDEVVRRLSVVNDKDASLVYRFRTAIGRWKGGEWSMNATV
jgi:hypothetical protein